MSFLDGLRLRSLLADLSQFPSVQPITPAAGALIDLDFAASAEEMAMKLDSSASWAIAFAIAPRALGPVNTTGMAATGADFSEF